MRIQFSPVSSTYDFTEITETEFQVICEAFAAGTPFSDIEELYLYSKRLHDQLKEASAALTERYRGR
jgi:hypothetical protein